VLEIAVSVNGLCDTPSSPLHRSVPDGADGADGADEGRQEVRLLGLVEVADQSQDEPRGASPLAPRGGKQRTVLAVLALAVGQTVPVSRLVDAIWPDAPPPTARRQVLNAVSGLRAALGAAVVTTPAGYRLDQALVRTDLESFVAGRAEAAQAEAEPATAAALLRRALMLWRGPALGGTTGLAAEAVRLEEQRLAALEERIDADLACGEHQDLVAELSALAAAHPLRERLWAQLMLALYRCGRQAEALSAFGTARGAIVDELGLEPGTELQRLQRAVLAGDPALDLPRAGTPAAMPGRAGGLTPAHLPAGVSAFTGREAQLRRLDALLERRTGSTVIAAITGTAGVGKTTLAVHWAQRARHLFPDGQLYVDLRGYDPDQPMRPLDALTTLLYGLGVPAAEVPTDECRAALLYRSMLADRRMLILLDNGRHADQLRPLLPGGAGCLVLTTSRDTLTGLVAREGAYRLPLDTFTPAESTTLLSLVLGPERVRAEAAAAADLSRLCGHLPLALRIAAADLDSKPDRTLQQHALRLRVGDRLTELEVGGDSQAATRAAFGLSYATLPVPARRLFRLLGLAPGNQTTAPAAAALAGISASLAARLLDQLATAHLISEQEPGRYATHDLLRLYARERANYEDGPRERDSAVGRLLDWYIASADAAADLLYPQIRRLPHRTGSAQQAGFPDAARALAWLNAERSELVAAVCHAAQHGPLPRAWQLADALRGYFWHSRHLVDWIRSGHAALAAAARADDPAGQVALRLSLGSAYRSQDRYDVAVEHYTAGTRLAESAGWPAGQAALNSGLGCVYADRGELWRAIEHHTRVLRLAEHIDAPMQAAVTLVNLGWARQQLGQLGQAENHLVDALRLHQQTSSHAGGAIALDNLAEVDRLRGRLLLAQDRFAAALEQHRDFGSRYGVAQATRGLAEVHRDRGRHSEARALALDACQRATEMGDRRIRATSLSTLGSIDLALGNIDSATTRYRQALQLAEGTGARYVEADACIGLAAAHRDRQPALGIEYALRAVDLARPGGYQLLLGRALDVLAGMLDRAGERDRATEAALQAVDIQHTSGYRLAEAAALLTLADLASTAAQRRSHATAAQRILLECDAAPFRGDIMRLCS
jgi:DNA-binding SARP family transcriptional activator